MQPVLDYLNENQARFLAEFCDYLRFPSVSAQPQHKGEVSACANWLVAHCRQIGLETKLCATAGHPIVIARTPAFAALGRGEPAPTMSLRGEPAAARSRRGQAAQSGKPHFMVYGHY